jgi:hypothetical protein
MGDKNHMITTTEICVCQSGKPKVEKEWDLPCAA